MEGLRKTTHYLSQFGDGDLIRLCRMCEYISFGGDEFILSHVNQTDDLYLRVV